MTKRYQIMLMVNFILLMISIIVISILLFTSSFETIDDELIAKIVIAVQGTLALLSINLIVWLKHSPINKTFKIFAIIVCLPVFIAMLVKPYNGIKETE